MLHIECRAVGQYTHSWIEYIKTHVAALVDILNVFFYDIKGIVDPKIDLCDFFFSLLLSTNDILKNVSTVFVFYNENKWGPKH